MIRNQHISLLPAVLALVLLLTALLGGCGRTEPANVPAAPAESSYPAEASGPAEASEAVVITGRADGERFEDVIILEGMEETVRYEHLRNSTLGFEMDYDYENFVRHSDPDREWFVSCWDDTGNPENYLEVRYNPQDAETVAAAVGAKLSNRYDIGRDDSFTLQNAGSCIRIDASADIGGLTMPDQLQMVYIIPASDGCRVVTEHYAIEASEGFGRRFRYMMESFSPLPSQGEKKLTDEEALLAIRNYCTIRNPELEGTAAADYPVYWEIQSSDGSETVVLFRSYTGALTRYYIDPVSGAATVTEFVPGIMDAEQRTDETLNAWDYLF